MRLFECKVDSILTCTRWLWLRVPNAQEIVDKFFDEWSRLLLGADFWRHAAALQCELGWDLAGFARVVRDVAVRRFRVLSLPATDGYRRTFDHANELGCGWAAESAGLLVAWGVVSWPS